MQRLIKVGSGVVRICHGDREDAEAHQGGKWSSTYVHKIEKGPGHLHIFIVLVFHQILLCSKNSHYKVGPSRLRILCRPAMKPMLPSVRLYSTACLRCGTMMAQASWIWMRWRLS